MNVFKIIQVYTNFYEFGFTSIKLAKVFPKSYKICDVFSLSQQKYYVSELPDKLQYIIKK